MRTFTTLTAIFLMSIAAVTASGQDNRLLFTVLEGAGETLQNPCPGCLSHLGPNEVGVVTPAAPGNPDGWKFAPLSAWNTCLGDHDSDADYYESLFEKIDAIQMRGGPVDVNKDMRKLYFSVSQQFTTNVPAAPATVRRADIVRILPTGDMEYFLTADQICIAFGMNCGMAGDLNIDALAVKFPKPGNTGAIYFSFEENQQISIAAGTYLVEDGAILCIPGSAITWNLDGTVNSVVAMSGLIALMEVDVVLSTNLVVVHSGVADFFGVGPTTIIDCDGLAIDKANGGTFTGPWGTYDNLCMSGESLTGGGVVSTAMNMAGLNGSIAHMNGTPLASMAPNPTTGAQVGLASNPAGSLNGLFNGSDYMLSYVVDSDYPEPPMPSLEVKIGTDSFSGPHALIMTLGPSGPGLVAPSIVYPNPGFPNAYYSGPATSVIFYLMIPPGGHHDTWSLSVKVPKGLNLIFQAVYPHPSGVFILSTPGTITT